MIDAYVNNARETIYLVMDLIEGLSLKQFVAEYTEANPSQKTPIGGLPELLCKSIIHQLLHVMKYLHSEEVSVCHRDVNPNNLMVSTKESPGSPNTMPKVTLIDFNVSRRFREKSKGEPFSPLKHPTDEPSAMRRILMLTQTGALAYTAPEIQQGSSYNEKVDMWGVGCILYNCLFGEAPFNQQE